MEEETHYTYPVPPPSQGPPVLDDGQTGSLLSEILLPYSYYPQVNAETYHDTTGSFSSLQSFGPIQAPIQGMGEALMPYYEQPLMPTTFPGHEGVPHTWIEDSAYAEVAEVDATHNSVQHSISTSATLDQGHLYAHADTGSHFLASSTLGIPPASTVGQYEERTSRNQLNQSTPMTKKRATASSRSSGRPTGARKAPEQSHSCASCGEEYAQTQGLRRHVRTKHHPSSCLFCDDFKYGRPEHYRNHLTKWHKLKAAVVDKILGKPEGSRRRTRIAGRDLP